MPSPSLLVSTIEFCLAIIFSDNGILSVWFSSVCSFSVGGTIFTVPYSSVFSSVIFAGLIGVCSRKLEDERSCIKGCKGCKSYG